MSIKSPKQPSDPALIAEYNDIDILQLIQANHQTQLKTLNSYLSFKKRKARIQVIQQSLAILERFLMIDLGQKDPEGNAVRELVIRAKRTVQSASLLALGGFEIPAITLLRDLLEIEFLLRYFIKNPNRISTWLKADRRTRTTVFSPAALRRDIAEKNKDLLDRMNADYVTHCEIVTHPSPASLIFQRSVGIERLQELLIWSSIIEVTIHSKAIAFLVAAIGTISDSQKPYFQKAVRQLKHLATPLKNDTDAAGLVFRARLGDKTAFRAMRRKFTSKKSPKA